MGSQRRRRRIVERELVCKVKKEIINEIQDGAPAEAVYEKYYRIAYETLRKENDKLEQLVKQQENEIQQTTPPTDISA